MSTKVCNICEKELAAEKFSGRHMVCNSCRSNKQKKAYKEKLKQEKIKNRPSDEVLRLCRASTALTTYCMTPGATTPNMEKLVNDIFQALHDVIEENNTFEFSLNVNPDLRRFIQKCEDNEIQPEMMRRVFIDNHDDARFKRTFGYTMKELDEMVRDELEEHQLMIDAVRQVYVYLIDTKQMEIRNNKLERICVSYYNPHRNILSIDNPLQISKDEFINYIHKVNSMEKPPISLIGFVQHKLFTRFLNSINPIDVDTDDV